MSPVRYYWMLLHQQLCSSLCGCLKGCAEAEALEWVRHK